MYTYKYIDKHVPNYMYIYIHNYLSVGVCTCVFFCARVRLVGSQKVYKCIESDNVVVLQGPPGFYKVQ